MSGEEVELITMKSIGFLLLFIIISSFTSTTEVSEEVKFKMFCNSSRKLTRSVSHDFVVIRVKNANTKEIKEICITANLISGALHRETGNLYIGLDCNKYPERYFEFSKDSALWNIGFDEYSTKELVEYSKTINVDSIVLEVKKGAMTSIVFEKGEQRKYFAHLMFNQGVITTSHCLGTTLSYCRR